MRVSGAHLRLAALIVGLLWSVMSQTETANATKGKPLAIRSFTMQTTRSVAVPGPLTKEDWGFANEPVAYTQAGGHLTGEGGMADSLTTTVEFETEEGIRPGTGTGPIPTRDPKDVVVTVPPGLLGNPTAAPRCPLKVVLTFGKVCPASTQVGVAVVRDKTGGGLVGPIVNVTPEAGQSAEFALENSFHVNFLLTAHVVRTQNPTTHRPEYSIIVESNDTPTVELYRVETTFWGVPADPVHDPERGRFCSLINGGIWGCGGATPNPSNGLGGESAGVAEVPFLTMPANCAMGPGSATVRADSWEEPGHVGIGGSYEGYVERQSTMPGVIGCNRLGFTPAIDVEPDTLVADAPVGLGVDLTVPQFEEPQRLATPELSKSVITLPPGLSISPGIVDGIEACNESGPEGINFEGPESEEIGLNGELQLAPGHCPDASVVGTATASTPLLAERIEGHVYLAKPRCGGTGEPECTEKDAADGDLYQLYLELGGKGALANAGVNIKVRLSTRADPATGQLTTIGEEIAQLPFSELKVQLNGGPRAALDNPPVCAGATTSADFSTWAAGGTTPEGVLMAGLPDATSSSYFNVDLVGDGLATPCPRLPFSPSFVAGTVTASAGKFSAFTLNISRKDREQYIRGVQVKTPPGLLGVLASVPLCDEARANAGTCPESSKLGTVRVASGAGSHPFEIEGRMYLTTSYGGAPFGLSIVTNAVAGPFNLGKVVVRAKIDVDPSTSALTITTDEAGPYAVPQIIFGVPLRLQRITVNVDRPNFMFNPTNCRAHLITASIAGSGQVVASLSSPFAAAGCKSLAFKPSFAVSTSGHTSRKRGASLDARLSFPSDAMGNDANVAYVKVSLPKQLPSYLPTLQKACLVQTFDLNPGSCPIASVVGIARADTPLLPAISPTNLSHCKNTKRCPRPQRMSVVGPVYFVSLGGKQFPQLIIVLEGDGVRVDLVGDTFIGKGITSSTFKSVPDVPVHSFELYLPQGSNHALAANGSLCRAANRLRMPTDFVAQNGAVLKRVTKITVTGCRKAATSRGAKRSSSRRARHVSGRIRK